MLSQKESRPFLQKLLENPPSPPFEPALLPMLFSVTRENSTASVGDLVVLIERSQKLSARLLSAANLAVYGQECKISSLHRAISLLGVREVRTLVVMEGMASVIKTTKLPPSLDARRLWAHQLKTAAIARTLTAALGGASGPCGPSAAEEDRLSMAPDEAYVVGLLHDIGKLIFAAGRPDLWEAVEEHRIKNGLSAHEAENDCLGMDHAMIGAEVLHRWRLPMLLSEPVNWHHAPEQATAYKAEAKLIAAASIIASGDFDEEGGMCAEALPLLPGGADAATLGIAAAGSLAATKNFLNLIN